MFRYEDRQYYTVGVTRSFLFGVLQRFSGVVGGWVGLCLPILLYWGVDFDDFVRCTFCHYMGCWVIYLLQHLLIVLSMCGV